MHFKISPKSITDLIKAERNHWILYIPILVGVGIILFSFSAANTPHLPVFTGILLALALLLYCLYRDSYVSLIYAATGSVLLGFLIGLFHYHAHIAPLTGKVYAGVIGKVERIRPFYNRANRVTGMSLTLTDSNLYKVERKADAVTDQKPVKKKAKKKRAKKAKKKTAKKAAKKPHQKKLPKSWLNVPSYQNLDRKFLALTSAPYQKVNWRYDGKQNYWFYNPPDKIIVALSREDPRIKVGDVVELTALLFPINRSNNLSSAAGASGFGAGEINIVKTTTAHEITSGGFLANLRAKIQTKIYAAMPSDEASIATALIVGNQDLISKEIMTSVRASGLAHLLSVSGLHLALAASIFFVSIRFLLARSEYLTLRFDIKKIAAMGAIASSYFYLELVDAPIPAVRSFVMVSLVLIAIILDQTRDAMRGLALAAFFIIVLSPASIFSVSFQLSFAATLALVWFYQHLPRVKLPKRKEVLKRIILKSLQHLISIVLASLVAEIAIMPFLIYHFNNVPIYGIISNLIAIPLTSIATMPLGFLSMILMPFDSLINLSSLPLKGMGWSITAIIKVSDMIASYHGVIIASISKPAFVFATLGLIFFCIVRNKIIQMGAALVFIFALLSVIITKQGEPILVLNQKFMGIKTKEYGMVFSKPNIKYGQKLRITSESKSFGDFSAEQLRQLGIDCDKEKCRLVFLDEDKKSYRILVLLKRSKISEICSAEVDLLVNLTAKYELPGCIKSDMVINNLNFYQSPTLVVYLKDRRLRVKPL